MYLFDEQRKLKSLSVFKMHYNLNYTFCFQRWQLTEAIPETGENIAQNSVNTNELLIVKKRFFRISKNRLKAKKLYSTLASNIEHKPTS